MNIEEIQKSQESASYKRKINGIQRIPSNKTFKGYFNNALKRQKSSLSKFELMELEKQLKQKREVTMEERYSLEKSKGNKSIQLGNSLKEPKTELERMAEFRKKLEEKYNHRDIYAKENTTFNIKIKNDDKQIDER